MNTLILLGSAIAILTYIPLWIQIKSGKVEQNLLSWTLWATLDIIVAIAIIVQNGNFLLTLAYALGSSVTALIIFHMKGRGRWTSFESFIALLVFACMIIWYEAGSKIATVAGTLAMLAAGIPQIISAWKKPNEMPVFVYFLYFIAYSLASAGGKSWTIKERFYPTCGALYCILLVIMIMQRREPIPAGT